MNRRHLFALLGGAALAPMLPVARTTFDWNGYDQPMIHTTEAAEWPMLDGWAMRTISSTIYYDDGSVRIYFPEPSA